MTDTNVITPVTETPQPIQSPTAVVNGVDAVGSVSTPPKSLHETTVEISSPTAEQKTEVIPETPKEEVVKIDKPEEKKVEAPYSFVFCPKCGTEIKEEYFFANKKSSITGQGKELGFTARTEETGDRVFLISNKKRYWVKNPETLSKLGFSLGTEKTIPFAELLQYPEYEPVDLTVPGSEFPRKNEPNPEEKKAASGKPYKIWG